MENIKRQYQAPALVDRGSVVSRTEATQFGQDWDGSPHQDDDTKEPRSSVPVGTDEGYVPAGDESGISPIGISPFAF